MGCDSGATLDFRYFTWDDASKMESVENDREKHGGHEKFANYRFDKDHFVKIVKKAVEQVKGNLGRRTVPIHDEM